VPRFASPFQRFSALFELFRLDWRYTSFMLGLRCFSFSGWVWGGSSSVPEFEFSVCGLSEMDAFLWGGATYRCERSYSTSAYREVWSHFIIALQSHHERNRARAFIPKTSRPRQCTCIMRRGAGFGFFVSRVRLPLQCRCTKASSVKALLARKDNLVSRH
jgi:hypothetical protein